MLQEINIRASSISAFFSCPKRWAAIHLDKLPPMPSTPPAVIGSAVHEGTAVYDSAILSGENIAPDDAAGVVVDYLQHPKDDVNWSSMTYKEAERRALGVYTRYVTDEAPNLKFYAVELPLDALNIDFPEQDITISLTGTLDRIFIDSEKRSVLDIKSGERVMSQSVSKHMAQLGAYQILAQNKLGIAMDAAPKLCRLQTSAEYKTDVVSVPGSITTLLGTDDEKGLLQHAAEMLSSGDLVGDASSWLCSEKFCPLAANNNCIFRAKS